MYNDAPFKQCQFLTWLLEVDPKIFSFGHFFVPSQARYSLGRPQGLLSPMILVQPRSMNHDGKGFENRKNIPKKLFKNGVAQV